ncbi:hypothetical protein OSTOST_22114, partial [Ostertagia ostertagi]
STRSDSFCPQDKEDEGKRTDSAQRKYNLRNRKRIRYREDSDESEGPSSPSSLISTILQIGMVLNFISLSLASKISGTSEAIRSMKCVTGGVELISPDKVPYEICAEHYCIQLERPLVQEKVSAWETSKIGRSTSLGSNEDNIAMLQTSLGREKSKIKTENCRNHSNNQFRNHTPVPTVSGNRPIIPSVDNLHGRLTLPFPMERTSRTTTKLLLPNVPVKVNVFTITLSNVGIPPTPLLNTRFISNGVRTALWKADALPALRCANISKAEELDCEVYEDCVCLPAENSANCRCRDYPIGNWFNEIKNQLPVIFPSITFRQEATHKVQANMYSMVTSEIILSIHDSIRTKMVVDEAIC